MAGRSTAVRWPMKHYQSAALGLGRDLATARRVGVRCHSLARSTSIDDSAYGNRKRWTATPYRVSYAKDFDELNSRVTFAGYRFSEKNYMTMSEYLDANQSDHGAHR